MKKILILTASFGEGHNAAARGVRDALELVAPGQALVEMHDLFAETFGAFNELARRSYLALITSAPRVWSAFYNWIDRKKDFSGEFRALFAVKNRLSAVLARFRPDAIVSTYPAYAHLLDEILGPSGNAAGRRIVIITDSITINAIWFRCSTDYFSVPNEATAAVLRAQGVRDESVKVFGFPVSPKFAAPSEPRLPPSSENGRRVLYMINAGKSSAPELTRRLAQLSDIQLTVTVGRDRQLQSSIEEIQRASPHKIEIVGWSEEMPRIMRASHLLISKAGGATVQETIAAAAPMIINQIVPGQEEGNAQLIVDSNAGVIATAHNEIVAQVERAFANDAQQWREWFANISKLSKPGAAFDIARFLISI